MLAASPSPMSAQLSGQDTADLGAKLGREAQAAADGGDYELAEAKLLELVENQSGAFGPSAPETVDAWMQLGRFLAWRAEGLIRGEGSGRRRPDQGGRCVSDGPGLQVLRRGEAALRKSLKLAASSPDGVRGLEYQSWRALYALLIRECRWDEWREAVRELERLLASQFGGTSDQVDGFLREAGLDAKENYQESLALEILRHRIDVLNASGEMKKPGIAAAAWNDLAGILRELSQVQAAIDAYKSALAVLDPNDLASQGPLKTNLGSYLGGLGRCEEALPLLREAKAALAAAYPGDQAVLTHPNRAITDCELRLGQEPKGLSRSRVYLHGRR